MVTVTESLLSPLSTELANLLCTCKASWVEKESSGKGEDFLS